jgi:hypothetical protein
MMETDQPCLKTEDDNIPQTEIRWTPAETNLDDPKNCSDEDCGFQMTYLDINVNTFHTKGLQNIITIF